MAKWIKNKSQWYVAYNKLTVALGTHTGEGMEEIFQASGNQNRSEIDILISDKIV